MKQTELAQKLADHFFPPHFESQRKNLPLKEFKALPITDRYEDIWVQKNPQSTPMVVEYADDGPYIRCLTYEEIAEAVLLIIQRDENEKN